MRFKMLEKLIKKLSKEQIIALINKYSKPRKSKNDLSYESK